MGEIPLEFFGYIGWALTSTGLFTLVLSVVTVWLPVTHLDWVETKFTALEPATRTCFWKCICKQINGTLRIHVFSMLLSALHRETLTWAFYYAWRHLLVHVLSSSLSVIPSGQMHVREGRERTSGWFGMQIWLHLPLSMLHAFGSAAYNDELGPSCESHHDHCIISEIHTYMIWYEIHTSLLSS